MSDRTFYARGEWEDEPDREEFVHAELPCLILRAPLGSLAGYVGVPPAHPAYGPKMKDLRATKGEGDPLMVDVKYNEYYGLDVHGGLTYSGEGDGELRPAGFYWFGFDCAHLHDFVPPTSEAAIGMFDGYYKNWAYVKGETQRLAEQFAQLMQPPSYQEFLGEKERYHGDAAAEPTT